MKVLKSFICLCIVFSLLCLGFSFSVSAASFSLYGNLSPDDSTVVRLLGLYRNSDGYDPFSEFLICRTGQFDYYLFYGVDLASQYSFIRYYGYQTGSYNTQWSLSYGSGSNLSIDYNGYLPVGNVSQSVSSSLAESFKVQYVVIPILCLIAVVLLFKAFRFRFHASDQKGWSYG